jgi:hypothetical protein
VENGEYLKPSMAIVALLFCQHNPFYNIRRYAACEIVQENEEPPFDEVDSKNACAQPRPAREGGSTQNYFVWVRRVTDLVRSINLSHTRHKVILPTPVLCFVHY